jgi:hypothetical protein
MDRVLATEIARVEEALRSALDDITIREAVGAGRGRTQELVGQARELADRLSRMVDRLGNDEDAEGVRRMAAYLHAHLAVLERDWASATLH